MKTKNSEYYLLSQWNDNICMGKDYKPVLVKLDEVEEVIRYYELAECDQLCKDFTINLDKQVVKFKSIEKDCEDMTNEHWYNKELTIKNCLIIDKDEKREHDTIQQ